MKQSLERILQQFDHEAHISNTDSHAPATVGDIKALKKAIENLVSALYSDLENED